MAFKNHLGEDRYDLGISRSLPHGPLRQSRLGVRRPSVFNLILFFHRQISLVQY
jgi:hypothetical protein